ncbi:MAG: hypothetical protein CMH62_00060 [Nanoarchaeota archaeon]|nr:hypothetical protein [Nanoarchaeota archaeon]|tara:strand:+ start:652 stop:1035 length:384 start_codon:yes stop_codon:yes gene_type:complete
MFRKILIVKKEKPRLERDEELQWISNSLGLFNSDRDKERSCYRVFVELVDKKTPLRSDDIAEHSRLSRGTVVFHLNKLMESGLVINVDNKYKLREKRISTIIKKMRKDISQHLKEIEEIAKDFESKL